MFYFITSVYNTMKGGSKIKKVILKFIGTGINNEYQAFVNIYDICGKMLYHEKTNYGKLVLFLEVNRVYHLVAISYGDVIQKSFYVMENKDEYTFWFSRSIYKHNNPPGLKTITFLLNDANYDDLPIEEGEMFLWPKQ